jgi:lipoprotein signal peptidase
MKQETKNTLEGIFWFVASFSIVIMIIVLILAQIPIQEERYYTEKCNELGGSITMYECFNSGNGFCDLDTTKTGVYCVLQNGTEVDLTIRNSI